MSFILNPHRFGGLRVYAGTFTKATTVTTQAITGLGFKPKAVIFFGAGSTAAADSYTNTARPLFGVTTGASENFCSSACMQNSQATTDVDQVISNTKCIRTLTTGGATGDQASLSSFDNDGFTLNWTHQAAASADLISFLAIGGPAVSAKAIAMTAPGSVTSQAFTGAGFLPTMLLTAMAATTAWDTVAAGGGFNIGAVDSAGHEFALAAVSANGSAAGDEAHHMSNTDPVLTITSAPVVTTRAGFTSFDADGFTLNYATSISAFRGFALCLKGLRSFVGTSAAPASAGDGAVTGVGFTPKGLLLATTGHTALNANSSSGLGVGVAGYDGARLRGMAFYDDDSADPTDTGGAATTSFWRQNDETVNQLATATVASVDSDGFTLTWAGTPGSAYFGFLALA